MNGRAVIQMSLPETLSTRPLHRVGWSPLYLQAHSVLFMLHLQSASLPLYYHSGQLGE